MVKIKLVRQVESRLPSSYGEFHVYAFSELADDKMPHVVLLNVDTDFEKPVTVRIHSECLTGDVFHSLRCDCGEQLDESMEYIKLHGGVLIYLRQEGRGIGLIEKLKAYNLQDEGLDTFEANTALGHQEDERDFTPSIQILKDLNIHEIDLITNNPAKLEIFYDSGIVVRNRIDLAIPYTNENRDYLLAKVKKKGHFLNRIL